MRKTYDPPSIFVKDANFVGIGFTADAVAEHEVGVKEICSQFGISSTHGKATKVPLMCFETHSGYSFLSVGWKPWDECRSAFQQIPQELHADYEANKRSQKAGFISGAWDNRCFGIVSSSTKYLTQLYEAILKCDIAILYGYRSTNFLMAGGLIIARHSMLDVIKKNNFKIVK